MKHRYLYDRKPLAAPIALQHSRTSVARLFSDSDMQINHLWREHWLLADCIECLRQSIADWLMFNYGANSNVTACIRAARQFAGVYVLAWTCNMFPLLKLVLTYFGREVKVMKTCLITANIHEGYYFFAFLHRIIYRLCHMLCPRSAHMHVLSRECH